MSPPTRSRRAVAAAAAAAPGHHQHRQLSFFVSRSTTQKPPDYIVHTPRYPFPFEPRPIRPSAPPAKSAWRWAANVQLSAVKHSFFSILGPTLRRRWTLRSICLDKSLPLDATQLDRRRFHKLRIAHLLDWPSPPETIGRGPLAPPCVALAVKKRQTATLVYCERRPPAGTDVNVNTIPTFPRSSHLQQCTNNHGTHRGCRPPRRPPRPIPHVQTTKEIQWPELPLPAPAPGPRRRTTRGLPSRGAGRGPAPARAGNQSRSLTRLSRCGFSIHSPHPALPIPEWNADKAGW